MLTLSTVMLNSADPARLADFYRGVLGEPGFSDEHYTGWQAGHAYLMVGPHSEVGPEATDAARVIINFETEDVRGEFDRLTQAGAKAVAEPYNPGGDARMTLATLADPDGNLFQLASPMPSEM